MVRVAIVVLAVAAGIAGCALFGEGPPENTCRNDSDCFQAQGEVCNEETSRCEPGPDGGIVVPPVDAAIDAAPAADDDAPAR